MSAGAKQRRQKGKFANKGTHQCLTKYRYHSYEAAERVMRQMQGYSRAYKCKICNYLHLTSKPLR